MPRSRSVAERAAGDGFRIVWEEAAPYFVRHLSRAGEFVRATLVVRRENGALMDIDPRTGEVARLVRGLPRLDKLAVAESGWCVSAYRPRASMPTHFHFFDADLKLQNSIAFGPAVNDATCLEWGAVVGTRDGMVHGFDPDGRARWEWRLPGTEGARHNRYAAWRIVRAGEFAVVSVADTLYCVNSEGGLAWTWRTPLRLADDEIELTAEQVARGDTGPGMFDELISRLEEIREEIKSRHPLDDPALADDAREDLGDSVATDGHSTISETAETGNPYVRWVNRGGMLKGGGLGGIGNSVQSLSPSDGVVAVGDSQSCIHSVSAVDGHLISTLSVDEERDTTVVIADRDGRVRGCLTKTRDNTRVVALDESGVRGHSELDVAHYHGVAIGSGLVSYTGSDMRGFDRDGRERWRLTQPGALWAAAVDDVCVFNSHDTLVAVKSDV